MDDFTYSILTLLVVSPAMVVLLVLLARGVRDIGKAWVLSTSAKLHDSVERKVSFHGKLCR